MKVRGLGRLREAAGVASLPQLARATDATDCPDCTDGLHDDGSPCSTCDGNGWTVPASSNASTMSEGEKQSEQIRLMSEELNRLREGTAITLDRQATKLPTVKTSDGRDGYAVTLIREGLGNTGDNRWYTREGVRELVDSGRAEGMQAYANHPPLDQEDTLPERDVKQLVGTYHDVKFAESGGKACADAVLVPIGGPGYDWVQTLAEAAATHKGPKPLCGISLYGGCGGEYSDRPDGSFGALANRIYPVSGDIVTNAGAGGEFQRRLMESARGKRALREASSTRKAGPMTLDELKAKMREANTRVREADTPEKVAAAVAELDELVQAEVTAPAGVGATTLETLAESQPQLLEQLRESAKAEVKTTVEELQSQLRESQRRDANTAATLTTLAVLRERGVTAPEDLEFFDKEVGFRQLREQAEIEAYVDGVLDRDKRMREATLEAAGGAGDGVVGVPGRVPAAVSAGDGGLAMLREAGIPTLEPAAAA